MKIKTNSLEPGQPKQTEGCTLFSIYRAFATDSQVEDVRQLYADGIAWGEMKQLLFEHLNNHFMDARKRYDELIQQPDNIENILQQGADKARSYSIPLLKQVRQAVGIKALADTG